MNGGRELPVGLESERRTPDFTAETCPAGLLRAHRTATWARLEVAAGTVEFVDEESGDRFRASPSSPVVIAPNQYHHVVPSADAVFAVQFFRAAETA